MSEIWYQVFETDNMLQSSMVKSALETDKIEVREQGRCLQGAIGELPPLATSLTLWVAEAQVERALNLIEQHTSEPPELPEWCCQFCHENNPGHFQQCWSCQQGDQIEP